jgi:hypothetical protein
MAHVYWLCDRDRSHRHTSAFERDLCERESQKEHGAYSCPNCDSDLLCPHCDRAVIEEMFEFEDEEK